MCLSQSPISIPLTLVISFLFCLLFPNTQPKKFWRENCRFHFDDAYRSVFQPPRDDFRALHPKISTKSVCMRRRKTIRCECVNRKKSFFNILRISFASLESSRGLLLPAHRLLDAARADSLDVLIAGFIYFSTSCSGNNKIIYFMYAIGMCLDVRRERKKCCKCCV